MFIYFLFIQKTNLRRNSILLCTIKIDFTGGNLQLMNNINFHFSAYIYYLLINVCTEISSN